MRSEKLQPESIGMTQKVYQFRCWNRREQAQILKRLRVYPGGTSRKLGQFWRAGLGLAGVCDVYAAIYIDDHLRDKREISKWEHKPGDYGFARKSCSDQLGLLHKAFGRLQKIKYDMELGS